MRVPEFFAIPINARPEARGRAYSQNLADTIMAKWGDCGWRVNAWVEERVFYKGNASGEMLYEIKTDLVNGLPVSSRTRVL